MKKRDKQKTPPTQSEIIDNYIKSLEKKDKKQKHKKHRPSFTRRRRIFLPIFIVLILTVAGFLLYHFDVVDPLKWLNSNTSSITELSSETLSEPETESETLNSTDTLAVKPERPSKLFSVTLSPEEDFSLSATDEELLALTDEISTNGFTAIFVNFNTDSNLFTDTEQGIAVFNGLSAAAKEKALSVFGVLNVTKLSGENICDTNAYEYTLKKLDAMLTLDGLDGVMLNAVFVASVYMFII